MNDLISELVSKLGIQPQQAQGGAGILFKLAQERLGGDFSQIAKALPEAKTLIASAPEAGGAAKLVGGLLGKLGGEKAEGLGDFASMAGAFSKLNLDAGMIAKFIPIVLEFAKSKGGQEVVSLLAKALKK